MSLTFEMANLDFAPLYGAAFKRRGDDASAKLMERIVQDEIGHVSFGRRWLQKWKLPENSEWETWVTNLPPLMPPSRAKGFQFFEENRRMCGISEEWIQSLKKC